MNLAPLNIPHRPEDLLSRTLMVAAVGASAAITTSPSRSVVRSTATSASASLAELLHDARARCKIKTNAFAMHFGREWQQRFFVQLDTIMDIDEWDPADPIVTDPAFTTLLRLLLMLRGTRRPGLGIGPNGNIIAAWTNDNNRLTLECRANDDVRWIVSLIVDGKPDTAAGTTTLKHLFTRLAPYNPAQWFINEGRQPQG